MGCKEDWYSVFSSIHRDTNPTDWCIEKADSINEVANKLVEMREVYG